MALDHIDYVQATCDCCGTSAKPKSTCDAGDDGWRRIRIDKIGFTLHFGGVLCPACAVSVKECLKEIRTASGASILELRDHTNELPR